MEVDYLEELLIIYEPLASAFEFLDMPQNQYYGCFLPTLITLKVKLIKLYNSKRLKYLQELLLALKEQLLKKFKSYYELSEQVHDAVIAAISYPPVKTRFLMGLQDTGIGFNFQPRNLLIKYGRDYHHMLPDLRHQIDTKANLLTRDTFNAASSFFDFGDTIEIGSYLLMLSMMYTKNIKYTSIHLTIHTSINENFQYSIVSQSRFKTSHTFQLKTCI